MHSYAFIALCPKSISGLNIVDIFGIVKTNDVEYIFGRLRKKKSLVNQKLANYMR